MNVNQNSSKTENWKARIEAWRSSGKSRRQWCLENGIPPNSLAYWLDKFYPQKISRDDFVEIPEDNSTGVEIQYKGFKIHIGKEFDETILCRCLKVIRSSLC